MSTPGMSVVHDPARQRYEIVEERGSEPAVVVGFAEYRLPDDGHIDFVHTVVDPAYGGRGLAGELMEVALADARSAGRRVRPYCSYVARWIEKHPEYADITDAV